MMAERPGAPLVSVLIRSMDRPTLQRALQSAARQTWPNLEIVVIAACGSSHRPLPETLLDRELRLILPTADSRLTRPQAGNEALRAARGEWLIFLDDDDEFLPEHVSALLGCPRPNDERVVYCAARVHDADGRFLGHIGHPGSHTQLYFQSRSNPVATLIHRSLIEAGVCFDAEFPVHEDHDFQINCATRTAFAFAAADHCIWNAQIGDSGCGFAANDDPGKRIQAITRLRAKWAPAFAQWLHDDDALIVTGTQFLREGELSFARQCLERAVVLRPADADVLSMCGMVNFQVGNLERAEYLMTRALRNLPDSPQLRDNLALIRSRRPGPSLAGRAPMNFTQLLRRSWQRSASLLCVGLDPEPGRLPAPLVGHPDAVFEFCRAIVDATADLVCCFKPQIAHFAAQRAEGALERLIAYIHESYAGVLVILDAKRGDIGSTANHYAAEAFDRYGADAVTLNPYLGRDALQPFLDRADKGAFILCHTSNAGAKDLQELTVRDDAGVQLALYQHIATLAARDWNANGNCALVVGATYPEQLAQVRRIVGDDLPMLVPGVGAQGGDVAAVVNNGTNAQRSGLIISSSRAILYAGAGENFAADARRAAAALREQINVCRA
jgi:orotidine-5'-phosphate decarboxylase